MQFENGIQVQSMIRQSKVLLRIRGTKDTVRVFNNRQQALPKQRLPRIHSNPFALNSALNIKSQASLILGNVYDHYNRVKHASSFSKVHLSHHIVSSHFVDYLSHTIPPNSADRPVLYHFCFKDSLAIESSSSESKRTV